MAESSQASESSRTLTLTTDATDSSSSQEASAVRLKLEKPKKDKKVNWTQGTVDNEHMNKKKSKCCCIYNKPRTSLDYSSSEEDETDCDHCSGHVEKKSRPEQADCLPVPEAPIVTS